MSEVNRRDNYLPAGDRVSIFLRGKTWYANYQLNGQQVRRSLKTGSKKEAILRAQRLETELDHGVIPQTSRSEGIDGVAQEFIAFHAAEDRAAKTLVKYRAVTDEIVSLATKLKRFRADQLDAHFADRFRAACKKAGNSPKTIYNKLIILRSLTLFAMRRKMCQVDPLSGYKLKKPQPTPQPCWTPTEADAIIAAAPPAYKNFFMFLRETGCRVGEAQFLTPADLDFRRGVIHIRPKEGWKPKTGDHRQIPMTSRMRTLLEALPRKGAWVFTAPVTSKHPLAGRQISERRSLQALKRVLKRLKLEGHQHTFRHTYISQALMKGVPEAVVRSWVGHVDPDILRLYTHVADDVSKMYVERFSGSTGVGSADSQTDSETAG